MTWHNEPRRHALSAKGIKNAVNNKPLDKVPMKQDSQLRTIPMRKVMSANSDAGMYWFSPNTIAFFNSQFGGTAYLKPGSDTEGYFITSEKSPNNPRKYTIRNFDLKTGDVGTEGEFQAYNTEKQAEKALKELLVIKRKQDSPPIPDTPSRFEPPPYGYDDWEQFNKEYGHEVDDYGN